MGDVTEGPAAADAEGSAELTGMGGGGGKPSSVSVGSAMGGEAETVPEEDELATDVDAG